MASCSVVAVYTVVSIFLCNDAYYSARNPTPGNPPDPSNAILDPLRNVERYSYDPSVFNFTISDSGSMPLCALNGEDCYYRIDTATSCVYSPVDQSANISFDQNCIQNMVVSLGQYPVIIRPVAGLGSRPNHNLLLYNYDQQIWNKIATNATGVMKKGSVLTYSEGGIIYLIDLSTNNNPQPYRSGEFVSTFRGDETVWLTDRTVHCDYGGLYDETTTLPFTPMYYAQGELGIIAFSTFHLAYIDEYYCSAVYPYFFNNQSQIQTAWIKNDTIYIQTNFLNQIYIIAKAECQANFLSAYPVQTTTDIYGNSTSLYAVQCPQNPICREPFELENTGENATCVQPAPNPAPTPSPVKPNSPGAICKNSQYYRYGCQNHTRCADHIEYGNINTPRTCRPVVRCTGYIYNGTCYPFTNCNIEVPGNETHDHICKRPDGLWDVPELCGTDKWAYFNHGSFQSCVAKQVPKLCSNGQLQNRFGKCPDIGALNVSTCVTSIILSTNVDANQFDGCTDVEEVVLLSTVQVLGTESFQYTLNLRKVVFPITPIVINTSAFAYSGIEYLDLKGPATILPYAFLYSNITTIDGTVALLNIDALSFTPQLTSVPVFNNSIILGRQFFETSVEEFHCVNCTFLDGNDLLGAVELNESLSGTNSLGEPLDPTLSSPGFVTRGIFAYKIPPFLYALDSSVSRRSVDRNVLDQLQVLKQSYKDVLLGVEDIGNEYSGDDDGSGFDEYQSMLRIGKSITDLKCTINATAANSITELVVSDVDEFHPSIQAVLNVQSLTLINVNHVEGFSCSNVRTLVCENTDISDYTFANSPIESIQIDTTLSIGFASFANTLISEVEFNDRVSIDAYAFAGSNVNTTALSFCADVAQTSFDLTICCDICNYTAGIALDNCTVSLNQNKTCANCTSIEPGTFTENGQCMPCNGFCTVGQFAKEYCDGAVNIICETCPPGTYQDHISHRYTSCKLSKCSKSLVDDKCPPKQSHVRLLATVVSSIVSGITFIVYVQTHSREIFHYGNGMIFGRKSDTSRKR